MGSLMMVVMALMVMSMMALMMIKTMAMMTMEDTYLPAGICAGCAGDMNSCQGGGSSFDMNYLRVGPVIWKLFEGNSCDMNYLRVVPVI